MRQIKFKGEERAKNGSFELECHAARFSQYKQMLRCNKEPPMVLFKPVDPTP
jgi:hypothetical protein